MKKLLLTLTFFALLFSYAQAQTIRYVKSTGNGGSSGGTGLSWATASNDLQAMINASSEGDEVWVASSVNLPIRRADNLTGPVIRHKANAFVLKEGVKVYGGFPPSGDEWSSRDPAQYLTYLSGEIATNGSPDNDDSNNTWHVVIAIGPSEGADLSANTVLDGFIISGGRAIAESSLLINDRLVNNAHGGGIYNQYSNATFANLVIDRNKSMYKGGGVYNSHTLSHFNRVTIIGNAVTYSTESSGGIGGGMDNNDASPVLTNVLICKNQASIAGGLNNNNSSPVMTNVTISENLAYKLGGGVFNGNDSSPILTNVIISDNIAILQQGNEWFNHSGTTVIRNSVIWGNGIFERRALGNIQYSLVEDQEDNESYSAEANHNLPTGTNPLLSLQSSGDYSLKNNSPLINAGNNQFYWESVNAGTPLPLPGGTDLSGNPRVFYGRIDIGAYESQTIPLIAPGPGNILYVDQNVNGGDGSGSNWVNAMKELSDALRYARTLNNYTAENPLKIYVAKGIYQPLYSAEDNNYFDSKDRLNSFVMVKNVQVYGGFDPANSITELSHNRIFSGSGAEGTILSGDVGMPDVNTDNAYSVVISAGDVGSAKLDGFTVMGGNADLPTGSITVNEQVFQRNFGGGVCNWNSSPVLANLRITGNAAGYIGAGIYNYFSAPALTNVLITGNHAATFGGGSFNTGSAPVLTNVTISGNTAGNSGKEWYNASGAPVIRNSIIWGNGVEGQLTNTQYSLVQDQTEAGNANYYAGANRNLPPDTDPQFTDATSGDYSLSNASAAINAGNNSFFEGLNADTKDLAGNLRIYQYDEEGIIDLGAYENQTIRMIAPGSENILYVDQNVSGGDGSGSNWANAIPQLANALRYGRSQNSYTAENPLKIFVARGTYKPLYHADDDLFTTNSNRHNSFVMVKNVQLYGGFDPDGGITELSHDRLLPHTTAPEEQTILSGEIGDPNLDTDNVYNVVISAGEVGGAVLDGFTIMGGYAEMEVNIRVNEMEITRNTGGGICNFYSSPTLTHLNISRNFAFVGGGGMFNNESLPIITHVNISENAGERGAGIYNLNASPVLTNVTILDNDGVFGGGVYNSTSTPVLTNVTISGNTASYEGNEWYNDGGTPMIRNSIIWGNGVAGQLYDTQYSLIQDQTVEFNGNYFSSGNYNIDPAINPMFTNPATGDYTLLYCSPGVNAGTPDIIGLNLPPVDLLGQERVFDGRIDLGAFENHEGPSSGPEVAHADQELERIQSPNGTTDYLSGCNGWLASITTTGQPTDISGSTTVQVWIDETQPAQYLRRHYQISPADNASTATGRVTLYFTQDDFDAFSALNSTSPLPDGPMGDVTNLIIEKRGGESSDGTGSPTSYPGTPANITDVDVEWNVDQQRWEVSFNVTGFSGFFVKTTDSPLPVRWISFSAELNDQHQAVLDWKVDEVSVDRYEVERSANGKSFSAVVTVTTRGDGLHDYRVTDPFKVSGNMYYRIRQIDLDGSYLYSRVVSVSAPEVIRLRVFPNPTVDKVTVEIGAEYVGTKLRLINTSGVLLQEVSVIDPTLTVSLQHYAPGLYILYTFDGRVVKLIRE